MSTINHIYTFNYSQPAEYHFSHDSVFLAQFVFDWLKKNPQSIDSMADLCAGCGIIGMDLLIHLFKNSNQLPTQIDFIEVQNIYTEYFNNNKFQVSEIIGQATNLNLILQNYEQLLSVSAAQAKYDLIVCNPPYFKVGQGKLSPSEFKNRCRFFIDSDFLNLIKFVKYSLVSKGSALILVRSLLDHNDSSDFESIANYLELDATIVGNIRGTSVVLFCHRI